MTLCVCGALRPRKPEPYASGLQRRIRPDDRTPYMRHWAVVESKTFLRLLEVPANDVGELFELRIDARLKRVQVVDRHLARVDVPLMLTHHLVSRFDVGLRLVVGAEHPAV